MLSWKNQRDRHSHSLNGLEQLALQGDYNATLSHNLTEAKLIVYEVHPSRLLKSNAYRSALHSTRRLIANLPQLQQKAQLPWQQQQLVNLQRTLLEARAHAVAAAEKNELAREVAMLLSKFLGVSALAELGGVPGGVPDGGSASATHKLGAAVQRGWHAVHSASTAGVHNVRAIIDRRRDMSHSPHVHSAQSAHVAHAAHRVHTAHALHPTHASSVYSAAPAHAAWPPHASLPHAWQSQPLHHPTPPLPAPPMATAHHQPPLQLPAPLQHSVPPHLTTLQHPTVPLPTAPLPTATLPTAPLPTAPLPTLQHPTAPLPTAPLPTAPLPTAPQLCTSSPPSSSSSSLRHAQSVTVESTHVQTRDAQRARMNMSPRALSTVTANSEHSSHSMPPLSADAMHHEAHRARRMSDTAERRRRVAALRARKRLHTAHAHGTQQF